MQFDYRYMIHSARGDQVELTSVANWRIHPILTLTLPQGSSLRFGPIAR